MPVINNLNMLYVRDSSGKFVPVPALVGEPGKDGKSPKIRLYNASIIEGGGYIVEVEDVDGNVSRVQVQDGKDGASGNGISSVVLNDDYTLTLLFTNGTEYTTSSIRGAAGAAGEDGVDGKDGKDGDDGVSIISVEQTTTSTEDEGTNTIVVTLSSGQTEAFQIRNGSKGREGESGVYVGSGTPPDGTRVQIDPDGEEIELLTIDDIPEIATQAAGMVDVGGVVKITEQTFTDDEKAQARSNIGAASASDVSELSDNIADKLSINQGTANVGKILVVGTDGNLTLTDMPEGGVSGDVVGVLDDSNNILLSGDLADGTYTLKYQNADGTYTEIGTLEVGEIPDVEPVKTNFFDASEGFYGRLSSAGADRTDVSAAYVTNYIPVQVDDVVSVSGCTLGHIIVNSNPWMTGYDANKSNVYTGDVRTSNDYWSVDTLTSTEAQFTVLDSNIAYFRFCCADSKYYDIVMTADSDLVDTNNIVINIKRNGEWL